MGEACLAQQMGVVWGREQGGGLSTLGVQGHLPEKAGLGKVAPSPGLQRRAQASQEGPSRSQSGRPPPNEGRDPNLSLGSQSSATQCYSGARGRGRVHRHRALFWSHLLSINPTAEVCP